MLIGRGCSTHSSAGSRSKRRAFAVAPAMQNPMLSWADRFRLSLTIFRIDRPRNCDAFKPNLGRVIPCGKRRVPVFSSVGQPAPPKEQPHNPQILPTPCKHRLPSNRSRVSVVKCQAQDISGQIVKAFFDLKLYPAASHDFIRTPKVAFPAHPASPLPKLTVSRACFAARKG
jgi:hypothetical protein